MTIPEAAHIQLRRGPPDDEQGKCSKHVEEFNKCIITGVQLKSGTYFNISNLFTKIYNMLYYTTNLYLQLFLEMK